LHETPWKQSWLCNVALGEVGWRGSPEFRRSCGRGRPGTGGGRPGDRLGSIPALTRAESATVGLRGRARRRWPRRLERRQRWGRRWANATARAPAGPRGGFRVVVWRRARARGPLGQGVDRAPAAERLRSEERACAREVAGVPFNRRSSLW
jgi:hypothetical protein